MGAGHAKHIAIGDEGHAGLRSDGDGLVDGFERSDAHRAARTVDELDALGQNFIDAVAHERVGLAAADLHEHPVVGDAARDFGDDGVRDVLVAIFVQIFHLALPCMLRLAASPLGDFEIGIEFAFENAHCFETA